MDQNNEYDSDIQQEVEDVIDQIFDEDMSFSQKEELAISITFLIEKYIKRLHRYLNSQYYEGNNALLPCYPILSNTGQYNNYYLFPPVQNSFQPPIFNNYQQNLFPPMAPTMAASNPYQMQMFQQSQFLALNQPPIPTPKRKRKEKSKVKSRSKAKSAKIDTIEKGKKANTVKSQRSASSDPKPVKIKQVDGPQKVESVESKVTKKDDQKSFKSTDDQQDTEKGGIRTFSYDPSSPTTGIIRYLSDQSGKNFPPLNTVKIRCNCHMIGNCTVRSVLKYGTEDFVASNRSNFYITLIFVYHMVELTHYKITTGQNGAQISNWVFEISDDSKEWTQIDRQSNYSFTDNEAVFSVNQAKSRFVHYLRLRHDGPASNSNQNISIGYIELYGRMKNQLLVAEQKKAGFTFGRKSGSGGFKF